jgi:hypothetical protein
VTIPFEQDGSGVLVLGRHATTVDEVERVLVDDLASPMRRRIFDQWIELLGAIADIVPMLAHWMDGSFVTAKEAPDDIDVLTHVDGLAFDGLDDTKQGRCNALASGDRNDALPQCDSWLVTAYPEGHEAHGDYVTLADAWHSVFSGEADGKPKGYLELETTCLAALRA